MRPGRVKEVDSGLDCHAALRAGIRRKGFASSILAKILLVEDDKDLADMVCKWLANQHHNVEHTDDGQDGLSRAKTYEYDLIILDWNLPNVTGYEILCAYRANGGRSPVLLLTGNDKITDIEKGLDAGADDYVTKPFHARELNARLRALLRRPPKYIGDVLTAGDLTMDIANYRVERDGKEIHLLPKEFALLEFMLRNQNRVFPQDLLLEKVWPADSEATVDALTSCVKRLRKKIDADSVAPLIKTIHGVGYKLSAD